MSHDPLVFEILLLIIIQFSKGDIYEYAMNCLLVKMVDGDVISIPYCINNEITFNFKSYIIIGCQDLFCSHCFYFSFFNLQFASGYYLFQRRRNNRITEKITLANELSTRNFIKALISTDVALLLKLLLHRPYS